MTAGTRFRLVRMLYSVRVQLALAATLRAECVPGAVASDKGRGAGTVTSEIPGGDLHQVNVHVRRRMLLVDGVRTDRSLDDVVVCTISGGLCWLFVETSTQQGIMHGMR